MRGQITAELIKEIALKTLRVRTHTCRSKNPNFSYEAAKSYIEAAHFEINYMADRETVIDFVQNFVVAAEQVGHMGEQHDDRSDQIS